MIKEGRVELIFVGTKDNVADALTKPLPRESFKILRDQMLGITEVTCRAENLRSDRENALADTEAPPKDKPDCELAMLMRAAIPMDVINNEELPSDDSQGDHHGHKMDDYRPEDTDGDYYSDESWYPSSDEDGCPDYYRGSVYEGMILGAGAEEELPKRHLMSNEARYSNWNS